MHVYILNACLELDREAYNDVKGLLQVHRVKRGYTFVLNNFSSDKGLNDDDDYSLVECMLSRQIEGKSGECLNWTYMQ